MLTASLLDQGAANRTAEQIADAIDFVGGILGTGAGTDLTYINTVVMKDSLALGLQLMADVVRRPTFAPQEIERQRQQALSGLKVAAEDPDTVASQVIDRLIYGFHPVRPARQRHGRIARVAHAPGLRRLPSAVLTCRTTR